jgi:hypothetical protein
MFVSQYNDLRKETIVCHVLMLMKKLSCLNCIMTCYVSQNVLLLYCRQNHDQPCIPYDTTRGIKVYIKSCVFVYDFSTPHLQHSFVTLIKEASRG